MAVRSQDVAIEKLVASPNVQRVGRIHLAILKGFREECVATTPRTGAPPIPNSGPFHTNHENYIQWWIRMAEDDVGALLLQSQQIHQAAVDLKRAAEPLQIANADTYTEVSRLIGRFCDEQEGRLGLIEGYVDWLSDGNPRRPSILWSYKPVGSTNRMWRSPPFVDEGGVKLPPSVSLDEATRYVVNAYQHGRPVEEVYDESRGARYMAVEFGEYWSLLRESVETIISECRSQERISALMDDERFWAHFVRDRVLSESAETDAWDVKRTLDAWHCEPKERTAKEVQFVERAAAFANREGGVILIGFGDTVPRQVYGVPDHEHRATNVRDLLQRLGGLDSTLARVLPFRIPDASGQQKTCLAVAIAQTTVPIKVNQGDNTFSYPVRRGSDTIRSDWETISRTKAFQAVGAANFGFIVRLTGRFRRADT